MAIVWLKLSVQVLIQVYLICECVDSIAIIPVVVDHLHGDLVQSNFQHVAIQNDLSISEEVTDSEWWNWITIDNQIGNISSKEIEENWLLVCTRDLG